MMKSPTSLIRNWNAVGVMLALSAVFAVVISTISMPGDRATAQTTTDPAEVRAKAWWAALTGEQRVNVLLGKEVDNDATEDGRQLGDPTRTDTDTTTTPPGTPLSGIEIAQLDFDHASQTDENRASIQAFVDGDVTAVTVTTAPAVTSPDPTVPGANDIYAVGDHLDDTSDPPDGTTDKSVQNIRGFQSVELWWDHMNCVEMRTAVGEDNDALDLDGADNDLATTEDNESSVFCGMYSSLTGDDKARVDKVGKAILGIETLTASSATNSKAMMWWDSLDMPEPATDAVSERVAALYGDGAADEDVDDDDTNTADVDESMDNRIEQARAKYADLNDITKKLVNDRWTYIYHMGGMNDDDKDEVIYWWDSIGHTQRRIAVGVDNEPEGTPSAAGYSMDWDDLQTDPPAAAGKALQANAFTHGRAVLGLKALPDVAAWWATLNADQMVYVVYGNPPMRVAYDHDGDATNDDVTTVTDADKAVFQKPYDMLTGIVPDTDHLPAAITALLTRHAVPSAVDLNDDGDTTDTGVDHDNDATTDAIDEENYYSAKAIIDAIAMELFDPPAMLSAWVASDGSLVDAASGGSATTPTAPEDDNDFDWPYNTDNKPASVGDWWESTDCRVMRLAVGQDNQYLNAAVPDDATTTEVDESMDAETSIYCGHFVGSGDPARAEGAMGVLSKEAQERVEEVGMALLGLSEPGRPSFNEPAEGDPLIMGTAQVGATLKVDTSNIKDDDGIPEDSDGDKQFMYQWLRDGDPISGATGSSYVLTASDSGKTISVRVSFTDNERYPESRTSPASLATSPIVGSPGVISKIEEAIRGVTVSAGDKVVLSVMAYGLQGVQDQKLSAGMGLVWKEGDSSFDDNDPKTPWEVEYTAPSSPGTYKITASFANDGDCRPREKDGGEDMRDTLCTATFSVEVRRVSVQQPERPAPQNPPGEIPTILTDADGNQYEVFTPEGGGTFTGEGYSLTAGSGAIPNGEYIGIRVSDEGSASNAGMTHQRYTLGGNMYEVSAVDATSAVISSYALNSPATACLPLPDELRTNISDLAIVAINADDSLTILSASVRLGSGGTNVCGNLSSLPATLAVGSEGAPEAIPTATPEPTPIPPETGGKAPTSNAGLWALLLGAAIISFGTLLVVARRRERAEK